MCVCVCVRMLMRACAAFIVYFVQRWKIRGKKPRSRCRMNPVCKRPFGAIASICCCCRCWQTTAAAADDFFPGIFAVLFSAAYKAVFGLGDCRSILPLYGCDRGEMNGIAEQPPARRTHARHRGKRHLIDEEQPMQARIHRQPNTGMAKLMSYTYTHKYIYN